MKVYIISLICTMGTLFGQSYKFETKEGFVYIHEETQMVSIIFFDVTDSSTVSFTASINTAENYIHLYEIQTTDINNNLRALTIHLRLGELCETVCYAFSYDVVSTKKNAPNFMNSRKFWRMHDIINNGILEQN